MIHFKKTPAILIATHGLFCTELINSARMLYGDVPDVLSIPLMPRADPNQYEKEMEEIIAQYDGDIIVLVDVIGGTPFNTLLKISRTRPLCGLAGVNIPMLLDLLDSRESEHSGDALTANAQKAAQSAIMDMTPKLAQFHEMAKGRHDHA